MNDILDWTLTKRYIYTHHPLFKLKQISEDQFIVHHPWEKKVQIWNLQMKEVQKQLLYSESMQAIQYFPIQNHHFTWAGLKNGIIEGISSLARIQLKLQGELGSNVYINDMIYLKEGRLINCYNSGNLAIWDVSKIQNKSMPIKYLKNVHEDYVYKLRQVNDTTVVSCGNDTYTNLIDLQSGQVMDSYGHPDSVWCCYPITQHLLCSSGLFGSLIFRDLRSGRIAQVLQLSSNQSSYVTQLDHNHLVFGDRKKICRCDMRKLELVNHCQQYGMKVSAESIIVTPKGGIAVGRGGDMSLFQTGGIQAIPQQQIYTDNHPSLNLINFFNNFLANAQINLVGEQQAPIVLDQGDNEEDNGAQQDEGQQQWIQQDQDENQSDIDSDNQLL